MDKRFAEIKNQYLRFEKELAEQFRFVVRDTEKGIWGAADMDNVFVLFKAIKLDKCASFIDVWCGDGRVVLIASLFTRAFGIEFDKDLVDKGNEIKTKLGLHNAELICDDFYKHDFSEYDVLFINPDTGFYNGLEDKLLKEMRKDAVLYVYNNIFLPRILKRGKTHWFGQMPVTEFVR